MTDGVAAMRQEIQHPTSEIRRLGDQIEKRDRVNEIKLRSLARTVSFLDERLSLIEERLLDLECRRRAA
jgi:hypothetical protein